jgi:hypothetical protein
MRIYQQIGLQAPDILLPSPKINFHKWAVVACDQFTSQPDYWENVEKIVGDSPSTFRMILPEAYLGTSKEANHQNAIQAHIQKYLKDGLFSSVEGFIYIERTFGTKKRCGLIGALDLEKYDFNKGSKSLIRATEGTIIERLPPRIEIRKKALIELPHILVLIDDPDGSVIEPLSKNTSSLSRIYDFDLMLDGGHLKGFHVSDAQLEKGIVSALENLIQPQSFQDRYQLSEEVSPILFAVGDGNHSLAAAKSVWDHMKSTAQPDHPARFALVEIVNIHDTGIIFEPIHRILKNANESLADPLRSFFGENFAYASVPDFDSMKKAVIDQDKSEQRFGFFSMKGYQVGSFSNPKHTLAVGNVQEFLDNYRPKHPSLEIDFIHGDEAMQRLGIQDGNIGIYLPAMEKSQLFKTVIQDGNLPRKTFSMGEANEKRYYLECRRIQL